MCDVVSSMMNLIATVQRKCPGGVFSKERESLSHASQALGRAPKPNHRISVGSQSQATQGKQTLEQIQLLLLLGSTTIGHIGYRSSKQHRILLASLLVATDSAQTFVMTTQQPSPKRNRFRPATSSESRVFTRTSSEQAGDRYGIEDDTTWKVFGVAARVRQSECESLFESVLT